MVTEKGRFIPVYATFRKAKRSTTTHCKKHASTHFANFHAPQQLTRELTLPCQTIAAIDMATASIDGLADNTSARDDGTIDYGFAKHAVDPDLDAEVARFLELELFAPANTINDDSDNDVVAFQTSSSIANKATTSDVLFTKESDDAGFMDLIGSFDLPDLEFSGVGELSLHDAVELREHKETVKLTVSTASQNLQPTSSLLVQIPASALSLPTLPKTTTTTETGPPPVKKVRKRVKDEIEYLRQQVAGFEKKLEKLQQAPREQQPVAEQTVDAFSFRQGQLASQIASWEHVAKRQADEKEKSQAENAKLRENLNMQLSLARSLSNFLQSQQDVTWMEQSSEGRALKKLCVTPDGDESVFETLAGTIDTLYSELSAAVSGTGSGQTELEPGVKSDASGNVFIEYTDCSMLPFDYRTVASVMWKLTSTTSMDLGNRQYQAFSTSENTTRARLTTKLCLRREDKLVQMSCVGKRFVTKDRVAIVWAMMNETQDEYLLLNGKDRVRVRESGWIILKPASATTIPGQGRSQPGTIIQSISRLMPVLERSDDADSAAASVSDHVGMLTDVVLGLYHQNLSFLRQVTENSILNDEILKQTG